MSSNNGQKMKPHYVGGEMKRFHEFCMRVKIVAVEIVALVGFLAILAWVLLCEWTHLMPVASK
jgi:hypothetical protein